MPPFSNFRFTCHVIKFFAKFTGAGPLESLLSELLVNASQYVDTPRDKQVLKGLLAELTLAFQLDSMSQTGETQEVKKKDLIFISANTKNVLYLK